MCHSIGHKECKKCGTTFQTDLRGGAKWCFACKSLINREYQRFSRRRNKVRQYAAS